MIHIMKNNRYVNDTLITTEKLMENINLIKVILRGIELSLDYVLIFLIISVLVLMWSPIFYF